MFHVQDQATAFVKSIKKLGLAFTQPSKLTMIITCNTSFMTYWILFNHVILVHMSSTSPVISPLTINPYILFLAISRVSYIRSTITEAFVPAI